MILSYFDHTDLNDFEEYTVNIFWGKLGSNITEIGRALIVVAGPRVLQEETDNHVREMHTSGTASLLHEVQEEHIPFSLWFLHASFYCWLHSVMVQFQVI